MEKIVVAYTKSGGELISISKTEAEKEALEYIDGYPDGAGYRCPACGKNTLIFSHSGLYWD